MIDLGITLIENNFIYIDLWTFVHIFTVGLITYFISKKSKDFELNTLIVFSLIIVYELIEPTFPFFSPEEKLDTLWDIIIGMLTYIVVSLKILEVKDEI